MIDRVNLIDNNRVNLIDNNRVNLIDDNRVNFKGERYEKRIIDIALSIDRSIFISM